MKDTIITCFAGRRHYMEVQLGYVVELLNRYSFIKYYDIWNFAWSPEDRAWLRTIDTLHPKIRVRQAPDYGHAERASDVASKQFAYFFNQAYPKDQYEDCVFIKIDDDVVYVDVDHFPIFIAQRLENPDAFLFSADVINNDLNCNDPTPLHTDFLRDFPKNAANNEFQNLIHPTDKRLSINFVSWLGKDLHHIENEFSNGIGSDDEWRLCHVIPSRINRKNLILSNYKIAHMTFGTQLKNKSFDEAPLLQQYRDLYIKLYNRIRLTDTPDPTHKTRKSQGIFKKIFKMKN